jgi:GH43 family beta-xylosidase
MTCRCLVPAIAVLLLTTAVLGAVEGPRPEQSKVPGVVIDHSPASSRRYIGSPSLAVLPDGGYVASHDFFGPGSSEHELAVSAVFRSEDRGRSWRQVARIDGAFWSNLFVHRSRLYLLGTTRHHGLLVIRRSDDGGRTWTEPKGPDTGLLTPTGEYHTGPMPVLAHRGRLWRAVEDAGGGLQWGIRYRPMMISAPEDADLLRADSWTKSNYLQRDPSWLDGRFRAWLEGNAVATPAGSVVDLLRVNGGPGGKAAVVHLSDDGRTATFDTASGFIDMPGAAKKFTVRYDSKSRAYWSLVNPVLAPTERDPGSVRNTLALLRSEDLVHWKIRCILLHHPDVARHAFQYPDWQFDGDDLVAAIRTAYDDGLGGAHSAHDANYLTFHRFAGFRDLTMDDSAVDPAEIGQPASPKSEAAVVGSAAPPRTYTNPVIDEIGPADPSVILHEGKYYLYCTGDNRSYHVYYSTDLVHWTKGPKVFQPGEENVWAPDVFHDPGDGRFHLYYTVDRRVGVAVADRPDATFVDRGTLFESAIDAHMFRDQDGSYYLYYVQLPGFRICVQPMETPLRKKGEPLELIRPTEPWETKRGAVTEGPWMVKHRDTYHLLYSGTAASSLDYAIGYATAARPTGPFVKYLGNPIVKRGNGALGPGHGCVVKDGAGRLWSVYHQQKDDSQPWNRFICIDPFWFDEKGVLHGKATRGTPEPAPAPAGVQAPAAEGAPGVPLRR